MLPRCFHDKSSLGVHLNIPVSSRHDKQATFSGQKLWQYMLLYMSDCRSRGRKFDPVSGPIYYTFMEIDHEIISMAILLPSADSRRVAVS